MPKLLTVLACLACAAHLVAGCTGGPAGPASPVVDTGTPAAPVGHREPPDEATRQLASLGVQTAALIGPALRQVSQLMDGFYGARDTYGRYRVLSGVPGWDFRSGWYWHGENDPDRTLRVQFQDGAGTPAGWDVTLPSNYEQGLQEVFPDALARYRVELDQRLSPGGRVSLTFAGTMASDRTVRSRALASGIATVPPPVTLVGFEALTAAFDATGGIEKGELVLKSLTAGATLQFSGQYQADGLADRAKVYRNAALIGEVAIVDGQAQFINASGSHAL